MEVKQPHGREQSCRERLGKPNTPEGLCLEKKTEEEKEKLCSSE